MTTSPATAFLAAFNAIESHLRNALNARNSDSFSWMVRQAAQRRIMTERQSRTLLDYAELRNAIVHGEFDDGQPIADPREQTITTIEAIRDSLLHPPSALTVLGPLPVRTVGPEDTIADVLELVRTTQFTQFSVYQGRRFHGLLSARTLTRWVANDYTDNGTLDAMTVTDVLRYASNSEAVEFLPRNVSATTALLTLLSPGSIQFALITENGHQHETPLRVIGRSDLPTLHAATEPVRAVRKR